MKTNKLLSYIILVKNDSIGLEKTLRSIIANNLYEVEIIIVNANHNSDVLNVLSRYDKYIDKLIIGQDSSIYDAMNIGFKNSKSKYITYINAGDTVLENFTDIISDNIDKIPDMISTSIKLGSKINKSRNYKVKNHIPIDYIQEMPMPHPGLIVLSTFFDKVGYFNTNYKIVADHEWLIRAINLSPKIIWVNKFTVLFSLGGISNTFAAQIELFNLSQNFGRSYIYGSYKFLRNILVLIKYKLIYFYYK